jgi:hypothetical protein
MGALQVGEEIRDDAAELPLEGLHAGHLCPQERLQDRAGRAAPTYVSPNTAAASRAWLLSGRRAWPSASTSAMGAPRPYASASASWRARSAGGKYAIPLTAKSSWRIRSPGRPSAAAQAPRDHLHVVLRTAPRGHEDIPDHAPQRFGDSGRERHLVLADIADREVRHT